MLAVLAILPALGEHTFILCAFSSCIPSPYSCTLEIKMNQDFFEKCRFASEVDPLLNCTVRATSHA